jgi:L-threonylcarbamoyladenylate synthase
MKLINAARASKEEFALILSLLHEGRVIGFPTDTAYGLGADPFNDRAVGEIFRIKGRPESKPILLLVDSLEMTEQVAHAVPLFRSIAQSFWPGPLTLVLPAREVLPDSITAGTGTIGLRWPVCPFATMLVEMFGKPITATSANRTGQPTCITASEVSEQIGEFLPVLIDGGELPARTGSTLLDLTGQTPILLREGPVRYDSLEAFLQGRLRRANP